MTARPRMLIAGAGSAAAPASPTSAADWLEQTQAVPRPSAGQVDRLAADVARSMGAVLRFLLSHVIVHTMRSMGVEGVCLGGDFAFEMARHRLLPEDPLFERAWVHPQRGAAALALGAALADWFDTEAEPGAPHPDVGYPYLGAAHSNLSLEDFLQESGIPAEDLPADMIPSRGAELLLHRNRVGWFQDREESGIGPAGHRNRLSMLGREALDSLTDPLESGAVPEPLTLFVLGDEADRYFDPEATPPFGSAPVAGHPPAVERPPAALGTADGAGRAACGAARAGRPFSRGGLWAAGRPGARGARHGHLHSLPKRRSPAPRVAGGSRSGGGRPVAYRSAVGAAPGTDRRRTRERRGAIG